MTKEYTEKSISLSIILISDDHYFILHHNEESDSIFLNRIYERSVTKNLFLFNKQKYFLFLLHENIMMFYEILNKISDNFKSWISTDFISAPEISEKLHFFPSSIVKRFKLYRFLNGSFTFFKDLSTQLQSTFSISLQIEAPDLSKVPIITHAFINKFQIFIYYQNNFISLEQDKEMNEEILKKKSFEIFHNNISFRFNLF